MMEERHSWGRSAVFMEDRHDSAPRQDFVQKTFILRQTASFGKAQTWQVITHIGDAFLTKVWWGSKLRLQRTQ
jgi:hypothetical protein